MPLNLDKKVRLGDNKYGIPEMLNTPVNVHTLLPFNFAKTYTGNTNTQTISFFLDDYQFERVWNRPDDYTARLQRFTGCLSPDFSIWTDMPKALQLYNIYRSRWIGSFWQLKGIPCICTLSWADTESFDFAFLGCPEGGQVAISSMGIIRQQQETLFLQGLTAAIEQLNPSQILWYGNPIPGYTNPKVRYFEPFFRRFENGRTRN